MATLTAGGIGSGLDISSLVSQLVAAERAPTSSRLDRQEAQIQARISAFGGLRSALAQLQAALGKLKKVDDFLARKATSSNDKVFTVAAASTAAAGTFEVTVERLAQAHKLVSQGYASADEGFRPGTLTLSVGGESFSVAVGSTVSGGNPTLADIRAAINGASDNTGVTATLVTVDDVGDLVPGSDTATKLVLTSSKTGSAGVITVTAVEDPLSDPPPDPLPASLLALTTDAVAGQNLDELRAAQDARIFLDGQPVTRSSNTIADAIDGVTITLKGVSAADAGGDPIPDTLSVEVDRTAATGLVQGFVAAYNAVADAIRQVASYNASTREATSLFGDSTVRGLQSSLRAELGRAVAGLPEGSASLTAIGITTGTDGKLSVDSAKLETAFDSGLSSVASLFAADDGYARRLDELVSAYVDSDGLIEARTDGLTDRVKDITKQREALDRRMGSLQARLLKQFTAMDALVGQLQATGTYLTQQLASLQAQTATQG